MLKSLGHDGRLIGLDRELHQKPSGIRTNLLICFASSLFTFLSPIIAGETGNNKGQIAANIVQGIGFLGAGLILQNRNRVSGLTSAATVFAVAWWRLKEWASSRRNGT